jgi:hypothetical protein
MKRFSILAVVSLLALALVMPATVAASSHQSGLLTNVPVTGALEDGGTFEGLLSITNISVVDGALQFAGSLTGTATDAGGTVTNITQSFTGVLGTLTGGSGTGAGRCQILDLDLGPIFLDLLGLEVDLSAIELDITAVRGAGNLLGNLLCAVAGLLDGDGGLGNLLNNLLRGINRILG